MEQCEHRQQQQYQQSQIVANIENTSINYEIDDDGYSQISFKHHLRQDEGNSSRGSLHNVYDNTSISTTNTSATTRNLACGDNDSNFLKMIPVLQEEDDDNKRVRPPNETIQTSMFVENSDILNDQNYPLYYRHSSLLLSGVSATRSSDDARKLKEKRRYSDTKLLNSLHFENEFLVKNAAQQDDALQENFGDLIFDQMELNIQNILDLDKSDQKSHQKATDASERKEKESLKEKRNIFQSLPNLEIS